MNTAELTKQARELKELKVMAQELEDEITAIEDSIKAEMTAKGTDELQVDAFKVRWTKVISNRFDTTAFKQAYNELYKQFTRASEMRRFSIV